MGSNILIKKIAHQGLEDFIALVFVFEEVFEMKNFLIPPEEHLRELLSKDGFFAFVAVENNRVVGGLTAYLLHQYYSSRPLVYIYDLAVKKSHQRQGIGKGLIDALCNYCKDYGTAEVFVQADREDEHAVEFYRSTGGNEEDVLHFTYPLNPSH